MCAQVCVVPQIVLIGHSFGGTIVHSLPALAAFRPENVDVMIALAAPIAAPPVKADIFMEEYYVKSHKVRFV